MPFNTLLLTSLMPGTSVSESGVNVSVKRQADETVLFFRTDSAHVRKNLGIRDEEPGCDYLAFYKKEDRVVLCLVELKGSDVKHAVEQIEHTYKHISRLLKQRPCGPYIQHVMWKAYVCCNAHSPLTQTKPQADKLKEIFGQNNFGIARDKGKEDEFGKFLRS